MASLRSPMLRLAARSARPTFAPALARRTAATDTVKAKASEASESVSAKASELKSKAENTQAGARASSFASSTAETASAVTRTTVHWANVGREMAKQMYILERLTPPSPGDFMPAYRIIVDRFRDSEWWKAQFYSGQWTTLALMFLEVFFIFKIGEMVGRGRLIGYETAPGKFEEDKE